MDVNVQLESLECAMPSLKLRERFKLGWAAVVSMLALSFTVDCPAHSSLTMIRRA